jgi:hypothetical protein
MLIIQRSQIASFSAAGTLATGPDRPYIPSCAEHGAGVGRSNTGRLYEAARKGRSGKSVGVVDETATGSANFFGPPQAAPRPSRVDYDRRDAPAPAEHRPGSHRARVGDRARDLHLLRASCRRRERCVRDRDLARLLRGNLALRAAARRGRTAPPRPQASLAVTRLRPRSSPAGRTAERARTAACA